MRLQIEPRPQPSQFMKYGSPLISAVLMAVTGIIIFTILGKDPLIAFHTFFIEPINDFYGFGELLIKASPLMLIGVGLAIGFRANIWNIGAEGQLTVGAIAGGGIALLFFESMRLPLMGGLDYPFLNFFLNPTNPINPEPSRKMVAGSGTGLLTLKVKV